MNSVSLDLRNPQCLGLVNSLLDKGFLVRLEVTGQSMRPFLQGGERVTLAPAHPARLRLGDLVVHLDPFDAPVLHRIVYRKTIAGRRVFCVQGDGLGYQDEPFAEDRIMGKAVAIEWPGRPRKINLESPCWQVRNFIIACLSRLRQPRRAGLPLPGRRAGFLAAYSFFCRAGQKRKLQMVKKLYSYL